jgi:hypothetical protein
MTTPVFRLVRLKRDLCFDASLEANQNPSYAAVLLGNGNFEQALLTASHIAELLSKCIESKNPRHFSPSSLGEK